MRAKLVVSSVVRSNGFDELTFRAVQGDKVESNGYPQDGADDDNTFARFTPTADLRMVVHNPALLGKIEEGQKFYVDFTRADVAGSAIEKMEADMAKIEAEEAQHPGNAPAPDPEVTAAAPVAAAASPAAKQRPLGRIKPA